MEKKLFTIILIHFFLSGINSITAQELNKNISARESSTAHLKDQIITIDGLQFDYRILKYYPESTLRSMSEIKRKQIHLIYTQSFTVLNLSNCSSLKESDIDISKVETLRKENEENIVSYGTDCRVNLKLISKNLLDQRLLEIK